MNGLAIIKTWEGGLSSHGGAIGVIIAVYCYYRFRKNEYPSLTFVNLLDMLAIPVAFVAVCIRLGNFVNQEILGTPTTMPWGVIFGHPNGLQRAHTALHPAQLYEAVAYLLTFIVLAVLWRKKRESLRQGTLIGLFFILIFGARFVIEFWKANQSLMIDESFLQTGQYLSIPFILMGAVFVGVGFKQPIQQNNK
jgi:prolipoprotein diacylglyceryl transferase